MRIDYRAKLLGCCVDLLRVNALRQVRDESLVQSRKNDPQLRTNYQQELALADVHLSKHNQDEQYVPSHSKQAKHQRAR